MTLLNRQNWTAKAQFIALALLIGVSVICNHAASALSVSQTRIYSVTNPSPAGQPVILYAQVVGPPGISGTPTGSITFFDGLTTLGSATLDDGFAIEVSFAITGNHPIVAKYSGDSVFQPSTSTVLNQFIGLPQPSPAIASCRPTSSLTTLVQGPYVTAYVPNGTWSTPGTGVLVVPIEPSPVSAPSSIATPSTVNSCSANPVTGETVCTGNDTRVYLVSGSKLNATLTSGATGGASFSGGTCENCGVAINAVTNTAVITIGDSSAPSKSGLQFLNLSTKTFSAPVPAAHEVTEDVVWDPSRNLILSPDEEGVYDLFRIAPSSVTEFGQAIGSEMDSAAEDCTTGIGLASNEDNATFYITDLTKATFTTGSPAGTWAAPGQLITLADLSYGRNSGISVAPGSHLMVTSGEFGGNQVGVLELPASSGSGVPTVVDYAGALLPNTPDGNVWSAGQDPHTVTSYISPNTGNAYGLLANSPPPTWLAVIDLQALLNAPRTAGTHRVSPSYDLIAHGVVTYIKTR